MQGAVAVSIKYIQIIFHILSSFIIRLVMPYQKTVETITLQIFACLDSLFYYCFRF